jgi:hypothetical protein
MRPSLLASFTLAAVTCLAVHAKAAKAPLPLNKLQESDLIVVGTIRQIRIESEPSYGLGNYDWGIYVTLAVENVEKGELTDTEIEFRCYRRKQRRTNPPESSGHRPIPGTGTTIRAYLNGGEPTWFAALPNGITASDCRGGRRTACGELDTREVAGNRMALATVLEHGYLTCAYVLSLPASSPEAAS